MKFFASCVLIFLIGQYVSAEQSAPKEKKGRDPSAVQVTSLDGDVEIAIDDKISSGRVIQINDKTNKVICYGLDRGDGKAMSCTKY